MNPSYVLLTLHGTTPDWNEIITFYVYDAFGVPGHSPVHASLMLIYTNVNEKKETFYQIKLDLQAGEGDLVKTDHSPTFLLVSLAIAKGVNHPWKYRMTCKMSFANLFSSISKSMERSMVCHKLI